MADVVPPAESLPVWIRGVIAARAAGPPGGEPARVAAM
jgi:hypothetical protein